MACGAGRRNSADTPQSSQKYLGVGGGQGQDLILLLWVETEPEKQFGSSYIFLPWKPWV